MLIRTRILVTGLVQGVGFRFFALRTASELGITGYARNLATGEVEIEAQGRENAIEEFAKKMRQGPRAAKVQTFERSTRTVIPAETEFALF